MVLIVVKCRLLLSLLNCILFSVLCVDEINILIISGINTELLKKCNVLKLCASTVEIQLVEKKKPFLSDLLDFTSNSTH